MKKKILVTDSLFIFDSHVAQLQAAGYEVERLDKPNATEEELCRAIKGKHGYILGGVERVTDKVIQSADVLEVISFTGSGYTEFIPGHAFATKKGIAITTAAGANALDVAEFTVGLALEMVRNFPLLQTPSDAGGKGFFVSRRLASLTIGILGFGRIGREVARLAYALGMKVIYTTRTSKAHHLKYARSVKLDQLLALSDIVTIHVDKRGGEHVLGRAQLDKMRNDSILINAAFPHAVELEALKESLEKGRLRAAFDAPADIDVSKLPKGRYIQSNAQTAFNTAEANAETSDRVTKSIINVLKGRRDKDIVNMRKVTTR